MQRLFIETPTFQHNWQQLGMTDNDLRELQSFLLTHPSFAPVIPGSGGARKIRHDRKPKGKSGGIRVIYVDFPEKLKLVLLVAYGKNDKDDLTSKETEIIKALIRRLEKSL